MSQRTPAMTPLSTNAVPMELLPSIRQRAPFAVERFPAARGWVKFVVFDGKGEYMAEVVMPARKLTEGTTDKLQRWAMKNDDAAAIPTLSLID